jgi:hypothetical protein
MRNTLIVVVGIVLLGLISVWIYFVGGVSAVYPPIKKYEYVGTTNQLLLDIQQNNLSNTSIVSHITDTVGTKENGYAFYMSIEIKNNEMNVLYDIKCQEENGEKTEIKLVSVNDRTNNIVGYQLEDKGVKALVKKFEMYFINPIVLQTSN